MAQFLNMYTVELNDGAAPVVSLKQIHQGNHKANRVGARVVLDGQPYTLGGNCSGTAILADGSTVPLTGTVSGNECYVELDNACYQVEGQIHVFVSWVSGQLETTLLAAVGTVRFTQTGNVIQPSTPVPDLAQLMAQITAMQEATAAANAAATKSVRYDTDQSASITAAQKATARDNILAASQADVTDLTATMVENGLAVPITGWISGARMLIPAVGEQITDVPNTSASAWRYIKIPCSPGDQFVINAQCGSATAYRVWAFADSALTVIERASEDGSIDQLITASAQAAYLYINQNAERGYCYSGQPIILRFLTKAPIYSPAFTGTPTAPTAAAGTASTQIANTQFVKNADDAISAELTKRIFAKSTSSYVSNNQVTLSDIKEDGFYLFNAGVTATDGPTKDGTPVTYSLMGLIVENYSSRSDWWGTGKYTKQTLFNFSAGARKQYTRVSNSGGEYYDWQFSDGTADSTLTQAGAAADAAAAGTAIATVASDLAKRIYAKPTSAYVSDSQVTLSDIKEDGFYLFNAGVTATDGPTKDGTPVTYSLMGLVVENYSPGRWGTGGFVRQTVFEFGTGERNEYTRVSKSSGTYNPWQAQAVVNNSTTEIINNNTYPQYTNTYNITTTPTITTDTNNFLAAVDTDTSSETGKTDMAGAILSMLQDTGCCHLGPGIFYVSGGIDLPAGATIEGCGYDTIVRLMQSSEPGYVFGIKNHNTIKSLRISGGPANINSTFTDALGTRHGIFFTDSTGNQNTRHCMIDQIWIEHFSGAGIYGYNSSLSPIGGMYVTQGWIADCQTGIYLTHYCEFNKFIGILTANNCYFGVFNGGGNNAFDSCTFHAKNAGFIVDGGSANPNAAHGLCCNCTFCHIGGNVGKAIWVRDTDSGYIFSCCQVHYCSINVEGSSGILFQGIQFGRGIGEASSEKPGGTIRVSNGALVAFVGCTFKGAPDIQVSNNTATKFDSCYDFATGNAITV